MFFFYQNQNHTHPSRYNLLVHGFKDLVVWLARLARQSLENSWIEAQQQPLTKAQTGRRSEVGGRRSEVGVHSISHNNA